MCDDKVKSMGEGYRIHINSRDVAQGEVAVEEKNTEKSCKEQKERLDKQGKYL